MAAVWSKEQKMRNKAVFSEPKRKHHKVNNKKTTEKKMPAGEMLLLLLFVNLLKRN